MACPIVFLLIIAQTGFSSCSMDEAKAGEKLMTSLQRVQTKLHAIRSIITNYSDHFCRSNLNNTAVRLATLQNCANHQTYVRDEWMKAMNPTLFELRHFRRTLLKVTGARKVLSPYFLSKISNFIQDEENIMVDAIRTATEICVTDQEDSPETQTIVQELNKFGVHHPWSPTAEELDTTTPSTAMTTESTGSIATTTVAPMKIIDGLSYNVEEWILQPFNETTVVSSNDTPTTADADAEPISGQSQDDCKYILDDERVIFSLGVDSPNRTRDKDSSQMVTPKRSEVISHSKMEEYNGTKCTKFKLVKLLSEDMRRRGGIVLTMNNDEDDGYNGSAKIVQKANMTTNKGETTPKNNTESLNHDWSELGTNWSYFNYGEDCSKEFGSADCRISVVESEEIVFGRDDTDPKPDNKPGLSDELSSGDVADCLNCSLTSNMLPAVGNYSIRADEYVEEWALELVMSDNSTSGYEYKRNNGSAEYGTVNSSNGLAYDSE